MKIVLFYHSLISDWNHGNAHFLRGICKSLQKLGNDVIVLEPKNNWSLQNLIDERGEDVLGHFKRSFPSLTSKFYDPENPELEQYLANADLVIVHEWNDPSLVKLMVEKKFNFGYKLLFHDTHHRAVSEREQMERYDLRNYDGVLAFGEVLKEIYLRQSWAKRIWVWHEAADTTLFYPHKAEKKGDVVWIGNWGDNERAEELEEYFINPVKKLGLKAQVFGVRYPQEALKKLADAGISYGGYIPSNEVPKVFASYKFTIHVPRRFYANNLPGIPTIRPFEAMACGIPLISAPWQDSEHLFRAGKDYLMVNNGREMEAAMQNILGNPNLAESLAASGLETILSHHTCEHRAKELLDVYAEIRAH